MNAEFYMNKALKLAERASGYTSPNPMVGAIIVKDNNIVGQGWHQRAGTPHAEIHALHEAGDLAKGATIYVTLEPCSHYGRTGPCADALIKAGIKKAVIAVTDPNPLVRGQGIAKLRNAGIEVVEGVLSESAARLNEVFIKWISTKKPFAVLKTAMTIDGKIATYTGNSKWITEVGARQRVHKLRATYDAVLTGVGTVLADDPEFTVRLGQEGKNPLRIIVDTMARTPPTAKVVATNPETTLIAVSTVAPQDNIAALKHKGVEILEVSTDTTGINLTELFQIIGARNITSVLLEGGAAINASALSANLIDKVYWFIAPKIFGGHNALGPVGGQGISLVKDAINMENLSTEFIGNDILISGYLLGREGRDVYRTCGRIG